MGKVINKAGEIHDADTPEATATRKAPVKSTKAKGASNGTQTKRSKK